ncbi:hypothetical protein HOY82DRAFT_600270 [Tuber indicum]|nr:hypothetical protein HOY82DRAFT_600270 [Tuber indicum]
MFSNPYEGMSQRSTPTDTSCSKDERATSKTPISSLNYSNAPPGTDPADTSPSRLVCPVSSCRYVFTGEMPHRHFWRHLKHPDLCGLNGDEEVAWLKLHDIEHERLLTALEDSRAEEQRLSRTAEFESRAKNMGITDERSVAEKVAIWEGMWAAEQAGNDIQYHAGTLLDAASSANE